MSHIIFYTKPGCKGGLRQKALLTSSGHAVEERSILVEKWTPDTLYPYLKGLDVKEWYNPNATAVKNGTIIPGVLPAEETLELLCSDPLLIKRPLMEIGDNLIAGFNTEYLSKLIELHNVPDEDLTKCQSNVKADSCKTI
ncbi:ArsC/Spx/MgsR family protein [Clostridium pasteurianum]|uniref:Nitrogenase-associated protein n=1 Tax=Clostridium pasteurianum BC1 TaxID=86416 RepID=R4K1R5_CLOPA|nr:ArsC/Spx/MgsR family protein [Clostridium pasteurianum]AGK97017.1 nitrogenase-associated protein [Clostridium pasteurianum BC1]